MSVNERVLLTPFLNFVPFAKQDFAGLVQINFVIQPSQSEAGDRFPF
jgi:hypothetical protein